MTDIKITKFVAVSITSLLLCGCHSQHSQLEKIASAKRSCDALNGKGSIKEYQSSFPSAYHQAYVCEVGGKTIKSTFCAGGLCP